MKKNLRRRIHTFLQSEEGKVSVKAPLALAVVSGSLLLVQIVSTSPVSASENCDPACDEGQSCISWCKVWHPLDGTCIKIGSECVEL